MEKVERGSLSDGEVTSLAEGHQYNADMISTEWDSRLTALHADQKRIFKEWVLKLHKDTTNSKK